MEFSKTSLASLVDKELTYFRTDKITPAFELKSGEELLATLFYKKLTTASGKTANVASRIEWQGTWKPVIKLFDENGTEILAIQMSILAQGGKGTLNLNNQIYRFGRSGIFDYTLKAPDGSSILTMKQFKIRRQWWPRELATLEITPVAASMKELDWLVLAMAYLANSSLSL